MVIGDGETSSSSQPIRGQGMPVLFNLTAVLTHGQRCQEKVQYLLIAVYVSVEHGGKT